MKKEAGLALGMGLLGLVFFSICTGAEAANIETTAPEIVGDKPAGGEKEDRSPETAPVVLPAAAPVILPANEPLLAEPQNQSPPQRKTTEEFSKDPVETVNDEPTMAETVNEQPTPATTPVIPLGSEPLVVEPQNQSPPQERMSEEFSKELAAADAAAREEEKGQLGWVFGLRAGIAIPTQKVIRDFGDSTSIGPLVNVEGLYAVKEWMRVGLMVEWHRHSIKMWGPEFGTLNTVSILPTVEFRPTREFLENRGMTAVVPYASLGLGVNANSLSKGSGLPSTATVSFDNTLAFRAAGGIDVPIARGVSLNAEVAYNLNSGGYQLSTLPATTDFNASTVNLLFGIRAEF